MRAGIMLAMAERVQTGSERTASTGRISAAVLRKAAAFVATLEIAGRGNVPR